MAVDWSALTVAVNEIRPKIKATLDFVAEEASAADANVGVQIAEHVAAYVPGALEILETVNKEIEAKTLTHDAAKAHFDKLKTLLGKVREEQKPIVAKLPAPVVEKIKAKLEASHAEVAAIAAKIYGLF